MDENLLRIGEIAGFFNVSVKAIRIYEKMGIIKPVKIDSKTKYRYYTYITTRLETSDPKTKIHELTEEERAWLLVKMVCVEDLHGQSVLSEALWV